MGKVEVIEKFWQLFDERKYFEARELFHDDCRVYMESSREIFDNIDSWLQMNQDYPGAWRTVLKRCDLIDQEAVSLTHVFSPEEEEQHHVISYYKFKEGLISEMTEYWGVIENQPEWRKKYSETY